MTILLCVMVMVLVMVITLPTEKIMRKNIYNIVRKNEDKKIEIIHYENKMIDYFIKTSRKVSKLIPRQLMNKSSKKIEQKLIYAGFEEKVTPEDFAGAKVILSDITCIYFMLMYLANPSSTNLIITIVASTMGYFVPDYWMSMKAKNRQWMIRKEVPTVLSALAIITDAGLNLVPAIEEVVIQNQGEFSKELKKTLKDIHLGVPQKEAFIKLTQRCYVEEVNYFVSALVQGIEKGSSGITGIIREQATESWEKRKHKAKELAEQASMKLFLPLLLLVFPAFIIFLIGPMIFSLMQMF